MIDVEKGTPHAVHVHTVDVGFSLGVSPCVERVICILRVDDGYVVGQSDVCAENQIEGFYFNVGIEMRNLPSCVHSLVRPAARGKSDLVPQNPAKRFFHKLLNGNRVFLGLPAAIFRSYILNAYFHAARQKVIHFTDSNNSAGRYLNVMTPPINSTVKTVPARSLQENFNFFILVRLRAPS